MNLPSPSLTFFNKFGEQQSVIQQPEQDPLLLPNAQFEPFLARATFSTIPSYTYLESVLATQTAITFQPFSKQVAQFKGEPIRCKRCKSYLQTPFTFNGRQFTCQICGRENEVVTQLTEIAPSSVDFVVSDQIYATATADNEGTSTEFLNPGEVSHVQSEVLSHPEVFKACSTASRFPRDFRGSKDPKIPSSERCLQKQLKNFTNEQLGADSQNQLEQIEIYRFIHVFIVQTTFNSIYQGVLECVLSQIENFLISSHPNVQIAVCFNQMNLQVFQMKPFGFELIEVVSDQITGEPTLPLPIDDLCFDSTQIDKFRTFKNFVLEYYYQDAKSHLERYKLAPSTLGDAISGAISSLQRTGGIVTAILTDRPTFGVGGIAPEDIKTYTYTSHDNAAQSKEAAYYNGSLFYNRLAREAADHNVSVNLVGLPFNNFSLGLQQLAPLCYTTGGSLYFNEPARLAKEIQDTGNYQFLVDCIAEIFTTDAIACTFTARCSHGVDLKLYEEIQTEEIDGVVNQAKNVINSLFKQKAKNNAVKKYVYHSKDQVYGSFSKISDLELSFPSMKRSTTFSAKLSLQIQKFTSPKLQFAVLYTAQSGERKVRCHFLQLEASEIAAQVFNSCDQFQLITYMSKQLSSRFLGSQALQNKDQGPLGGLQQNSKAAFTRAENIAEESKKTWNLSETEVKYYDEISALGVQNQLQGVEIPVGSQKLVEQYEMQKVILKSLKVVLKAFKEIAGDNKQKMLIPQSMQLLPLFCHSLTKTGISHPHRQMNEGGMYTSDMRIGEACFYLQEPFNLICNNLCPGIFNLGQFLCNDVSGMAYRPISANSMVIQDLYKNCFLFVSGRFCLLAIGRNCEDEVLTDLIGMDKNQAKGVFNVTGFTNQKIQGVFERLKRIYGFKGGVYLSSEDGPLEGLRRWMLVEDGTARDMSYQEFLQSLPQLISK